MTRILPFPKPTLFLDKPKARNTMVFFAYRGLFYYHRGCVFLLEVGFLVMEMHYWSAVISVSFRSTFIRALVTRCFAVEWSVRPVLTYFRKPMLATRCVEILLKFTHVRRDWRANMILWSPYFIAETFNVERRS